MNKVKINKIWFFVKPYNTKLFKKIEISEAISRYFDYSSKTIVGKIVLGKKVKAGLEIDSGYLFSRKINQVESTTEK